MKNETPKLKRSHRSDRVTLDTEAFELIEKWFQQLQPHLKGSRLSRSDLVSEIIKQRSVELSTSELKTITESYFDPARALLWAVKEVRVAQKSGQPVDLGELLKSSILPRKTRKSKKAKPERKVEAMS